ncbi:MAG: polymerase, sigma-24 subunit, subfamily [Actinomycetia bacterium]|nr:polymerase, sigma-24 subunit, subfamily [Actinomycetes bacterium]
MITQDPSAVGVRDFDAFFDEEYTPLLRLMFGMTGDLVEAEELAQEAMTRALERWERVRDMLSPAGYVYRTAVNLNRSRLRRLARPLRWSRESERSSDAEPEVIVSVIGALMTLSRGQREAILLVEWLGLDAREAGQILGISPSSVRSRVHRAKTSLAGGAADTDG